MLVSGGVYLRTFENDKDAEWKKSFQKNLFSQINGGPGFILFSWWFTMVQSATLHLKTNKMKSTKLCQSSSSDPPRPAGISGFVRRYGDRCQLECVRIFFWGDPKSMNISYTQNHHLFVYTSSKVEQLALPKMRKDWKTNSFPFGARQIFSGYVS